MLKQQKFQRLTSSTRIETTLIAFSMHVPSKRKVFLIELLCIIIGAIPRVFYCIRYPVQPRDAYKYEAIITRWETTGNFTDELDFFPLSLWILKAPYHFLHYDIQKGGIIINTVIGLLLIILCIRIISRYTSNNYVLLIVGLCAATHPMLIRMSCSFLRENSYLLFSILSFSTLLKYWNSFHLKDLILTSLFASMAFLCRLEGVEFVMIYCLLLFFLIFFKKMSFSKGICHLMLFSFLFFVATVSTCYLLQFDTVKMKGIAQKALLVDSFANKL